MELIIPTRDMVETRIKTPGKDLHPTSLVKKMEQEIDRIQNNLRNSQYSHRIRELTWCLINTQTTIRHRENPNTINQIIYYILKCYKNQLNYQTWNEFKEFVITKVTDSHQPEFGQFHIRYLETILQQIFNLEP